jgi:hypothetical protein
VKDTQFPKDTGKLVVVFTLRHPNGAYGRTFRTQSLKGVITVGAPAGVSEEVINWRDVKRFNVLK